MRSQKTTFMKSIKINLGFPRTNIFPKAIKNSSGLHLKNPTQVCEKWQITIKARSVMQFSFVKLQQIYAC